MNNLLIIDCSFFLGGLLPDEEGSFDVLAEQDVYVPSIFYLECINVLKTSLKRNRLSVESYNEYIHILRHFPLTADRFSSTAESLHPLSDIAVKYDLTSYDASYLELALRLKGRMATKDQKLIEACQTAGVLLL